MSDKSMMHSATPVRPMQIKLRSFQDAPARVPDVECDGGISKFDQVLTKDGHESGCVRYLVFYEGEGRYLAWRDED